MTFLSALILSCAVLGSSPDAKSAADANENSQADRYTAARLFNRNSESSSNDDSNSVERGVVLLDFYNDNCPPCREMMPTVRALATRGYRVSKVNTTEFPHWARRYNVRQIPCFIVIVDGVEQSRHVGMTSYAALEGMIVQAGGAPRQHRPIEVQGQTRIASNVSVPARSAWRGKERNIHVQQIIRDEYVFPELRPEHQLTALDKIPGIRRPARRNVAVPSSTVTDNTNTAAAPESPAPERLAPPPPPMEQETASIPVGSAVLPVSSQSLPPSALRESGRTLEERYLASTVRIHGRDSAGLEWCGSGTIIDCRQGFALVLTCGHLFREYREGDEILVDFFGPNQLQNVPARHLRHDCEVRDLGLIYVRVTQPVEVTPVAPVNYAIRKGIEIRTSGCTHGAVPTVRGGNITNINRFLGPANIEVSDVPEQGCSGGGLFHGGHLIGVCLAANPEDREGLFSSLVSIHEYLNQTKLHDYVKHPKNESVQFAESENPRSRMALTMPQSETPLIPTLKREEAQTTSMAGTSSVDTSAAGASTAGTFTKTAESPAAVRTSRLALTGEPLPAWPPRW